MAGALSVTSSSSPESLSGTYTFVANRPGLWFWATLDSSGGAQAILQLEGSAEQATVKLVNKDSVQMLWAAQTITGNGMLPDAAAVALAEFAASPIAEAAAMAALEIGCGTRADPLQLAALLAPWQLVLKYVRADRVDFAKSLASRASCTYFASPSSPRSAPAPNLLQLGFEDPIPNVFGIFPLDDVGAVEASPSRASLKKSGDLSGPCGAMCRGACGPDCTTNNCTLRGTGRCESDVAGRQTGNWLTANVYSCGTHQACREHDDCYDTCNSGRCGAWAAATCRRQCDLETVSKWPAQAPYWARGYGAFDNHIDFEYPDPPRYDPLLCPLKGGGVDASADVSLDGPADLRNPDLSPGNPDVTGRADAAVAPDVAPDRPEDTAPVEDAPVMNTWRMTNFEVVFEPHTDGCYKMISSSNGQAQAAGDCLYYEGQTFTETDTFTWTPPPAQISLPLYGSSSDVWWQGTLKGTATLSIPSAYNQPQVSLDIRAVQSTHPSDSYYVTATAPGSAKMTPTGTITIAAINGGAFTPDAHTGSPPLDPSPVVVSAKVSVSPSALGMLVFYLKYTYTRQ